MTPPCWSDCGDAGWRILAGFALLCVTFMIIGIVERLTSKPADNA